MSGVTTKKLSIYAHHLYAYKRFYQGYLKASIYEFIQAIKLLKLA